MQFSTKTTAPERIRAQCLVLPVRAGKTLTETGGAIDAAHDGRLSAALKSGDLQAKAGSTLLVAGAGGIARFLLVSTGEAAEASDKVFGDVVRAAFRHLAQLAADEVVSLLHDVPVAGRALGWKLRCQVLIGRELAYRFDGLKSKKDPTPRRPAGVVLPVKSAEASVAAAEVARAVALANGTDLTRDLGNMPPNLCTPTYLADQARALGRQFKLRVEVLDRKQMETLKMGALLAVAQGSAQPPKLIVVHYKGGPAKKAPVVLVGKGITFDTGGISLKPAADMDEMKYDMCGAASVLGTLRAIAEMKLAINVIGVVPTCENMPGGTATRPGDIVTSMSGQTIEILNTDAEGRLILCDALTYAERFKPAAVIDIATLTGACVVALGAPNSGLFTPNDQLADELLTAGRDIGDPCWRMPLEEEYQEGLKSPFADMANVGGRAGGAITAACFLWRYTKAYDWAHLDIAGTAWKSGANKGASARPVPLLTRFLIARAGA